jgi:hypothetical protein
MGMRIRVASDLVSVVDEKRADLLGVNAAGFGIAKIFGIEVEGAFHAVFVEELNETSVLRTAVVIAECERVALAILESVK